MSKFNSAIFLTISWRTIHSAILFPAETEALWKQYSHMNTSYIMLQKVMHDVPVFLWMTSYYIDPAISLFRNVTYINQML